MGFGDLGDRNIIRVLMAPFEKEYINWKNVSVGQSMLFSKLLQ